MIPGIADPVRFLLDLSAFLSIYLMLSVGMNLEYGLCGIPNLGKVLFFACGTFTVGALAARIGAILAGIDLATFHFTKDNALLVSMVTKYFTENPWVAMAILLAMISLGAIMGALFGFLASYPAIKLREDYLGIMLIVSGEIMRVFGLYYDPMVGGTLGVSVPSLIAWTSGSAREALRVAILMCAATASWALIERLTRSPFGRLLRAVRDCEIAASTYGKDVVKLRMKVLMLGSAIAGVAGVLNALYVGAVHPADIVPSKTFVVLLMVTIGGRGNNAGVAVGAFIYLLVERLIMQYKHYVPVPFDVNYLGIMLFGVVLLLMLMYKPEGIIPEKISKTIDFEKIAVAHARNPQKMKKRSEREPRGSRASRTHIKQRPATGRNAETEVWLSWGRGISEGDESGRENANL